MTATRLDIRWIDDALTSEADAVTLVRNFTQAKSHLRCPECHSILYTRRHKLCGVCGNELPEQFLFSPAEASRLNELLRTEQQRHRAWMNRMAES
jgi:hypothetical protein